jgi:hypothetical protein
MKAIALSGHLPEPRHFVPERDGFWDGFAFEIDEDIRDVGVAGSITSSNRIIARSSVAVPG